MRWVEAVTMDDYSNCSYARDVSPVRCGSRAEQTPANMVVFIMTSRLIPVDKVFTTIDRSGVGPTLVEVDVAFPRHANTHFTPSAPGR